MRRFGFSTGAVALGNFARAYRLLKKIPTEAIELSALRPHELAPLIKFAEEADLSRYSFISVHAPTGFEPWEEDDIARGLRTFTERAWPIVLHPDAIHRIEPWKQFGPLLYIENMDKRKPIGRTTAELATVFDKLPDALMCFDIAHARQCDTSMTEAFRILRDHGQRIREVHISEVNTSSKHDRISPTAVHAYQEVADLIPPDVPVILETPVDERQMLEQLRLASVALSTSKKVQRSSGSVF
jgi:sugar phosphate isomerase/epimerase